MSEVKTKQQVINDLNNEPVVYDVKEDENEDRRTYTELGETIHVIYFRTHLSDIEISEPIRVNLIEVGVNEQDEKTFKYYGRKPGILRKASEPEPPHRSLHMSESEIRTEIEKDYEIVKDELYITISGDFDFVRAETMIKNGTTMKTRHFRVFDQNGIKFKEVT